MITQMLDLKYNQKKLIIQVYKTYVEFLKHATILGLAFHIHILNGSRFISCRSVCKCQQLNRKKLGPRLVPVTLNPSCFLATQKNATVFFILSSDHSQR